MVTADFKEAVAAAIREEMPGVKILSVSIEPYEGWDGDPMLDVTVIHDGAVRLDPSSVAGMVRHLRPVLDRFKEDRFPILTFITSKDARKAGVAAE